MSHEPIETLLKRFGRRMALVRWIRLAAMALLIATAVGSALVPALHERRVSLMVVGGVLIVWGALSFGSIRLMQLLHATRGLLACGQSDNAEVWLRRIMTGLSLSPQPSLMAGQELATIFARRQAHSDVVAVCRALLAHRTRRLRHVWVATRIMLADSLLWLDRVAEAYEAIQPIYGQTLSLADRMKLLPVQLRYELASDHAASAVQGLAEKVQIAELLDTHQAALVHALLAEACRRQAMTAQRDFLLERARLYADLAPLAERYPLIAPIAPSPATVSLSTIPPPNQGQ